MNEQELAAEVARLIKQNTDLLVAFVGLSGVLIGALITIIGNFLLHWYQSGKERRLDASRIKLLKQMLGAQDWRKLSTLSRVIGADFETTRRLLIAAEARGSETLQSDEVWGLISKHPLSEID